MNDIVKYNNDMNKIHFTGLTKAHMDLFLAICSKVKCHGTDMIIIDTQELKEITHFERGGNRDFFDELHTMTAKLREINGDIVDRSLGKGKRKFRQFNLFQQFIYDENTEQLEVQVCDSFSWLLNEFENYTAFELVEFVDLKSKYSKHLYRLLKQWRTTGKYTFHSLDEFRELMDIPKKYSNKYMMNECVNVAVKEIEKLDKSFKDFKCEPIYARKRGKPLDKLMFTWKPEQIPQAEPLENQIKGQESFSDAQTFEEYMKEYQGEDKPSPVALKIAKNIEKGRKKKDTKKKNSFNNFNQRTYDYDELEKLLLTTPPNREL